MMTIGAEDLLIFGDRNGSDLETTSTRMLKPGMMVRVVKQRQQRKL